MSIVQSQARCLAVRNGEAPCARAILCSSHLRRRRRSNARRCAPAAPWLDPAPARRAAARTAAIDKFLITAGAGRLRVLHIDRDEKAAVALATLLVPEAVVINVASVSAARHLLGSQIFSLVVIDPDLPDGDARALLAALAATPVLVYAAGEPDWQAPAFLPKGRTTPRQLWNMIACLLGIPGAVSAGD